MNKKIAELITKRVTAAPAPYDFYIKAPAAGGFTAKEVTYKTFDKLKDWAEKAGAEVTLKHETFSSPGNPKRGHLVVEITDPAARQIEKLLEEKRQHEKDLAEDRRRELAYTKRFVRGSY